MGMLTSLFLSACSGNQISDKGKEDARQAALDNRDKLYV